MIGNSSHKQTETNQSYKFQQKIIWSVILRLQQKKVQLDLVEADSLINRFSSQSCSEEKWSEIKYLPIKPKIRRRDIGTGLSETKSGARLLKDMVATKCVREWDGKKV